MKKKNLIMCLMLVCVLALTFGLAACSLFGGGDDNKPIDLSVYLGTDAELNAMTPTDNEYFTFTELERSNGEDITYEISMNMEIPEEEIREITNWVIPATYNGKKVVQIAKDGFPYFGEKNPYDDEYQYTNVYIKPGIERICEDGIGDLIYILQLPSTLKVIEEEGVRGCDVFRAGNGLKVIKAGNSLGFRGLTYGAEANKYINNPICFPDSLEYCDLPFNTAEGGDNVKADDGVMYVGNPNNKYMIAHHYKKVGGKVATLNENCKIIQRGTFEKYDFAAIDLSKATKLTQVGEKAFYNADLALISLPDSVKYVDARAFANCSSLEAVLLSDSLVKISSDTFENCEKLSGTEYGFCDYVGTRTNPYYMLLSGVENLELNIETHTNGFLVHEQTKVIAKKAFYNAHLAWSWSGGNWEVYEEYAHLLTLTIPDTIECIGEGALYQNMMTIRVLSLPANWQYLSDNPASSVTQDYFLNGAISSEWPLTVVVRD